MVITAGCPQRYNPSAAPRVVSDNPQARQLFGDAKTAFQKRDYPRAEKLFGQFVTDFSQDPLSHAARVYRARILFEQGQASKAKVLLVGLPPDAQESVKRQAQYYLGLIQIRLGEYAAGRQHLQSFVNTIDAAFLPGTLAALAHAAKEEKDFPASARHLSQLYQTTDRDTEKAWARHQLEGLVDNDLDPPALTKLFDQEKSASLLYVLAGKRLAALAHQSQNEKQAEKYLQQIADAAEKHGIALSPQSGKQSRNKSIGVLLPLSGPYRAVGQRILAGATAGSGGLNALQSKTGFSVVIRDSARNAAAAAKEMITQDRVAALVGVPNPATAQAVADVAEQYQIPLITLSSAAPKARGSWRLQIVPGIVQRSKALAELGLPKAGTTVAILAPDNSYGRQMTAAFTTAAVASKATVTQTLFYPPSTRSFTAWAQRLKAQPFAVLFVPDSASRLGLIAPALAQAGLWPSAPGTQPPKGRPIRLLATADGVNERLLRVSGRYLEGALLCPGFFGKAHDAESSAVLQKYRAAHDTPPGLVEAFAFDAVHALHHFISKGIVDSTKLIAALRSKDLEGLTGTIRFGDTGQREGRPTVYVVGTSLATVYHAP